ncbi:MAG: DJ-1/PfpI family protein [Lachnospiraceae bacterium]|nr:DJ-1/PfpI family protein [Lachnospiraceae bacterium]
MAKLLICMADGLEEVEALTTVDLVRRGGIEMDMVSISDKKEVTGAHNITILNDKFMSEINLEDYDGIVLPGGMPGTNHLRDDANVIAAVKKFAAEKKLVAAICAAPTVLGYAGILEGKNATCYPGMEDGLLGASKKTDEVVCDGNIITSRGVGTAIAFALSLVSYFTDEKTAESLGKSIVYKAN